MQLEHELRETSNFDHSLISYILKWWYILCVSHLKMEDYNAFENKIDLKIIIFWIINYEHLKKRYFKIRILNNYDIY